MITQQTTAQGRMAQRAALVGLVALVMVVGALAVSVVGRQPTRSAVPAPAAITVQHVSLGIDLPSGATARELPTGLRDYLRPGTTGTLQHTALGIELPHGATARELPAGLRDYLRPGTTGTLQHTDLGIELPHGATASELPAGLRDYVLK